MRSSERHRPRSRLLAGTLIAAGGLGSAFALLAQVPPDFRESPFLRVDPQNIVLSERDPRSPCGECHTSEYEVWRETAHASQFAELHKKPAAPEILQALGLRVAKRQEAICMRCHYTVGSDLKAIAGVSCESCHGPARQWLPLHNDLENPADNAQLSQAAGMLRPSGNLYAVAANCFECHTVPVEELVNVGGHKTGSPSFDLVDRVSQIRHNFLHERHGETGGNREPSPERKRVMFALGRMLAYEFAVRGVAEASAQGRYFKAMESRAKAAFKDLQEVAVAADLDAAKEILAIGGETRLIPDNREALLAAAERMREVGQRFGSSSGGAGLSALDRLIEGGSVPATLAAGSSPASATDAADASTPASDDSPRSAAGGAAEAPAVPELPGSIRARPAWFPQPSGNGFVGPGECGSCHGDADAWWYDDPHAESGRRLLGEDPRAWRIATLYFGGNTGRMAEPGQICMSCHGTVDPGSGRLVVEGVSCESCHGAGSAFLDPHTKGGNPQLGMVPLKVAQDRAGTCSRCHHITDERLLSAGHPTGAGYDLAGASRSIGHFPEGRVERKRKGRGESYPAAAEGALRSAWAAATGGRSIPQVQAVSLPGPAGDGSSGSARASAGRVIPSGSRRAASLPPRPPATARARTTSEFRLDLEPLPESADSLTTEDLLLLVRSRLRLLYAALGREN